MPLIQRIVDEMRAFGIDIITANCEYAGSQWEINYGPGRGLGGPDETFTFKNGVKELAHLDGLHRHVHVEAVRRLGWLRSAQPHDAPESRRRRERDVRR